mmetsp:Transcript_7883/g.19557  ORF Transcript_7883/g.19557 Transcript_7883/m.19557 type:complete len:276 (-) Transcript_7883:213-1040(-)
MPKPLPLPPAAAGSRTVAQSRDGCSVSVTRFATPLPSSPPMRRMGLSPVALGVTSLGAPSIRKMCTVPFSLEAARSGGLAEGGPNASERMVAERVPRRKVYTLAACGRQCTRITVPLSDAVARRAPSGVSETAASGELCAATSHTTCRLMQSCTTTVPAEVDDGRASRELSASALSAHTPRGLLTVSMVRWTHRVPSSCTTARRSSTTTRRTRLSLTARIEEMKVRSAMQVWLDVLSTLRRRGDSPPSPSPLPTTHSRLVQKSISTMRTAPRRSS